MIVYRWVLVVLCVASCAPTNTQMAVDKTVRPGWIPSPNRKHPKFVYVTGTCRGLSRRFLARRCAIPDAETRLRRETNDPSVKVRGSNIDDEHFERRRGDPSSSKLAYDWWVLVAMPRRTLRSQITGSGGSYPLTSEG
jgi:hypothetical protein